METIIAAAISAGTTLVVCLITNRAQAEKTRALIDYRVGELEKKQDKHNQLVERTFLLEGQMRECVHEIQDLKKYHQPGAGA
jgi:hypothetical protein